MSFYVWETRHEKGENDVGKVKLTKEQADAIEWLLNNEWSIDEVIVAHARNNNTWLKGAKFLNGFGAVSLTKALRIGYEVEPEYKIGDWVVNINDYLFDGQIIGKLYKNVVGDFDVDRAEKTGMSFNPTDWRHATPEEIKTEKERRLWKKIGREIGIIKSGDVGVFKDGSTSSVLETVQRCYPQGRLIGFYPAESIVSFEEGEGE